MYAHDFSLVWIAVINGYFHSTAVSTTGMYIALLVFAGYVLYDTQLILKNAKKNPSDPSGRPPSFRPYSAALCRNPCPALPGWQSKKRALWMNIVVFATMDNAIA